MGQVMGVGIFGLARRRGTKIRKVLTMSMSVCWVDTLVGTLVVLFVMFSRKSVCISILYTVCMISFSKNIMLHMTCFIYRYMLGLTDFLLGPVENSLPCHSGVQGSSSAQG